MNKILHIFNKLFNITQYEWPRVIFWFLLKTLIFWTYVIWSTLLTAIFLEEFHIESLPLLYILIAWATILWSITVGFFLESFEKKRTLIWLSVAAIFIVSLAWIMQERSFEFFFLLISFVSITVTQISIVLSLFIEELFSPLESERTLPFIESAEPVWWIIAWAILAFWATSISINWFIKIIVLALIILMILISLSILLDRTPRLISQSSESKNINRTKRINNWFRHIRWIKFLKSMTIIVFIQFALFSFIEYQYTSALDQSITHKMDWEELGHKTHHETHNENASHNETKHHHQEHVEEEMHWAAKDHDSWGHHSYASQLAHWLWFYHVIFSILFFLSQIFISWRLNKNFWIIKTMMLHPSVMLIPSFWLLSFSLWTAVSAKAFFEVLTWIHRTAYHASIYALKNSIRDYVKEFFEWVAKPMWTIIWTLVLIVLTSFLHWDALHIVITIIIIILLTVMIIVLMNMRDKYTLVAKKNIETRSWVLAKLESIEVLTQKWHNNSEWILGKILHKNEIPEIKEKILYSLWEIWSENSIPDILDALEDKNKEVQKAALIALSKYKKIWKDFFSQSFTKHRILDTLKKLFKSTRSKEIKSLVIQNFSNLQDQDIVPFLIEILEKWDDEIKKNTIYICKYFNDINIYHYIQKFLKSKNANIKASSIIALWQFTPIRLKLTILTSDLLISKDNEEKLAAIYILWEIWAEQEIPRLVRFLNSDNKEIRRVAAVSLLKMNNVEAIDHVIEFILHKNKNIWKNTKHMLKNVPEKTLNHVKNLIKHEVIDMIKKIIHETWTNILEEMPKKKLEDLMHYYYLIDEYNEVIKIKHIMKNE